MGGGGREIKVSHSYINIGPTNFAQRWVNFWKKKSPEFPKIFANVV